MKKSWGIIKDIINKNKDPVRQTKFKLSNGSTTTDKMSISEHFNDFFINIGPNLAKLIPRVKKVPMAYMGDAVRDTIFLEPVTMLHVMKSVQLCLIWKIMPLDLMKLVPYISKCLCQVLQVLWCIYL